MYALSRYGYARTSGPGGLIFGYGGIGESEIVEGVRLVAEAMAAEAAQGRQASAASPVVAGAAGA